MSSCGISFITKYLAERTGSLGNYFSKCTVIPAHTMLLFYTMSIAIY